MADLPPDLEEKVLQQFDELADRRELLYAPSVAEHFEDEGFKFEVRVTPIQKDKPVLPPDDPGRTQGGGPFLNPRPSEVITAVGPSHRLLLNKFAVYRPMLLLTTIEYEKQSSDLNEGDIAAVWAVINALKTEQVAIYNCGVNSGSSQGHKHMQVFPIPDPAEYVLWPSLAKSEDDPTTTIPTVPFKHYILLLSPTTTSTQLYTKYQTLLQLTNQALKDANQEHDYNIALTKKWIALIPRSRMAVDGPFGANALGMLGLVSVRDEKEKEVWARMGWKKHLRQLGIAR